MHKLIEDLKWWWHNRSWRCRNVDHTSALNGVWRTCQREAGHAGPHRGGGGWWV